MRQRIIADNLGTEMAPTERLRVYTPLTPRAVRSEIAKASMDIHESNRDAWMQARMTPLDKMLSDDEADCLERYVLCEQVLSGNARCGDYTGDSVMTSRDSGMSPLPDGWLVRLASHHGIKRELPMHVRNVLQVFVAQQSGNMQSDAECALMLNLHGRRLDRAWHNAVSSMAGLLVSLGY